MTPLGRFAVVADASEVGAFRAATGLPPGEGVPATFPMRWLAAPEVRDALLALVREPGVVPFHESQAFDYATPLVVGAAYALDLGARVERTPDRLVVTGTVCAADGAPCVRLETVLRLFPTAAAAA